MEALWWRVVTYLPPVRGKVLTRNLTTNMLIANIVVWTLNVGCSFSNTAFATMQAMDGKLTPPPLPPKEIPHVHD